MIRGASQDGGLARAAIEAALRSQNKSAQRIEAAVDAGFEAAEAQALGREAADPAQRAEGPPSIQSTIGALDSAVSDADRLPLDLVSGGIDDFSQLATRLKQSEMTFKFALEVRNKLIDAYRETMRMSV